MPPTSGPETPPSTAPTSPTSPTPTNDFIDCEKGREDGDEDEEVIEEVIEEVNEKGSDISSRHRKQDGRRKLVQRSKATCYI